MTRITGDFRIHEGFRSRFLAPERNVIVHLPPRYDEEPLRRYPVLYMHDGQNLFDIHNPIGKEWQVDEAVRALVATRAVEPMIVVGVYNTGEQRIDEFAPTRDRKVRQGGRAALYGRMLAEEMKPFIDEIYRTRQDATSTGLAGSSLGGLATLWLGLQYPRTFGRLGVISPSVWWDRKMLLREVSALGAKPPLRIWLSTGTAEGRGVLANTRRLRDALIARGWMLGDDLMYYEADGAGHDEHAWRAVLDPCLRFLFPPARASDLGGSERL
ncbi:MAG: alpha/beta hydrolase-fold protein [Gemmatimonadota bacterium]|nr:alpha/beta hydrolase-fold protein [Gemmatimonadota bacterium]